MLALTAPAGLPYAGGPAPSVHQQAGAATLSPRIEPMPRLKLIRHGKPIPTWRQAAEDSGLNEAGRAQAREANAGVL
jgi:hypothetical protein